MTVPEHDPVYKVTIIPRGRALGVTQFLPEQDRYSLSKRRIDSAITTLFGGRVGICCADSVVTDLVQFACQFGTARLDDPAAEHDVGRNR